MHHSKSKHSIEPAKYHNHILHFETKQSIHIISNYQVHRQNIDYYGNAKIPEIREALLLLYKIQPLH